MANPKKVVLSEAAARRLIKIMPFVERMMRAPKGRRRVPKVGQFIPIFRYKLTEDLPDNDHATATLTRQDASDGTWDDGTSPDDDEEVYSDASTFTAGHIPANSYILVWRNPATGLLNLLQGPCAEDD